MGYLHISNLYQDQTILMFKECYALEKIHGSSAHITWQPNSKNINFSSGGEKHETFLKIFDIDNLKQKLSELFLDSSVTIYGEVYGGKCQGMSNTYGKQMKFVVFDVKVNGMWLNVPNAFDVAVNKLGLEFVDYVKVTTDLESLDKERHKDSVQAVRNGCGEGKIREGVILRPIVEMTLNNGSRVIAKHKRDEFKETKTPREVSEEEFKVMTEANQIAEEYVTEMRLYHVLDKLPHNCSIEQMKLVINAMVNDVYREAKGEIIESKLVTKSIGTKTAILFKRFLENKLREEHE